MKKWLILISIFFYSTSFYSQINFENAYFINNSGQKVDCLIKNEDWYNNPNELKYKISEDSEQVIIKIENVKEFEIYNKFKFIRSKVKIDKSTNNLNNLTYDSNPLFADEEVFLKILVEGKSNLYWYKKGEVERFFYNIDNSNIEQLIYKIYKVSESEISRNETFKQQLLNNLNCSKKDIESIEYKMTDLINFFVEYNKCNNSTYKEYNIKNEKKDLLHFSVKTHLKNSSLSIQNPTNLNNSLNGGSDLGLGIGFELEYILPYNKNKWSIGIEPTYQKFNSEKSNNASNINGGKIISTTKYSSLEIPFSLKHYLFLNNNSKIFINVSYVIDFSSNNSSVILKREDKSIINALDMNSKTNFAFGIGYKFANKYSVETRFQTNRKVLGPLESEYKTASLIFGYTLF